MSEKLKIGQLDNNIGETITDVCYGKNNVVIMLTGNKNISIIGSGDGGVGGIAANS